MIPFQVDPSWYEKYWWREPAPHRLGVFALLRRGLERLKKIQGGNVMTHALAQPTRGTVRLQQHRNIKVGGAPKARPNLT
ncbi:MAG: hypothetical protein QOI07_3911 [Verrucomicrobiota bacterium]